MVSVRGGGELLLNPLHCYTITRRLSSPGLNISHTEEDGLLQFLFTTKSLTNPGMFHEFFWGKMLIKSVIIFLLEAATNFVSGAGLAEAPELFSSRLI